MKFPFWRRHEEPDDTQRQLGSLILAKKVTRRMRGSLWIEQFVSDLIFGLKSLRKNPSFTVVAVLTLALAIGANTAIFSIIHAVVIRPLPFPDANRLVQIKSFDKKTGETGNWITYRDFVDLRVQNRSFESVGASRFAFLTLTGTGLPEGLYGPAVSYDLLTTLGVHPLFGRAFSADDDQPGHEHVVILSYNVWRNEFSGDKEIVGKKVHLTFRDNEDYEVVGVMPPDFNFPLVIPTSINPPTRQIAFWIPLGLDVAKQSRFGAQIMLTARLRAGVSLPQAQTDIDRINDSLAHEYPQSNTGRGARIVSFSDFILGAAERAMLTIWGATAIVLLVACVNIGNLLLAKVINRRRETGIRLALGANRWRLVRQWTTESVLLAFLGGCAGLALAMLALRVLVRLAPQDIPRLQDTRIDVTVLLLTLGISLLSGLLFGLLPAWRSADSNPLDECRLR